jgi:type VI secretion system secreted protein Hcp
MPLDSEGGQLPSPSCYLKIDGIKGDAVHKDYQGEIPIQSWSWGVTASGASSGGRKRGQAAPKDISFTAASSSASPALVNYLASGKPIKTAILTCVKTEGKSSTPYLTLEFSDVLVSSYQLSHDAGHSMIAIDQFQLNFSKVEMRFTGPKPDGSPGKNTSGSWDFAQNNP